MGSLRNPTSLRCTLGALLVLGATACASVQSRYIATPLDAAGFRTGASTTASGLVVSGEELRPYSSRHFGLVEVTFENWTNEWVHIHRLALDFGGAEENEGVLLPVGADLEAWHQATVQRNDIRDTNAATALGALLALGVLVAVVGDAGGRRGVAAAGHAVTLGAATASVVRDHDARVERAESPRLLPESHLLAVPFAIPPGLFAKKWVLLNTRDVATPCITSMLIDYDVEAGNERVLLPFRSPLDALEWQKSACALGSSQLRAAQARPRWMGIKGADRR
jgi:hypothetical protein